MSQHSRRKPSVNPSKPSDNARPPDGEAQEPAPGGTRKPEGPGNTDLDRAAPGADGKPEPARRPLIPGIDLDSIALEEDYEQSQADDDSLVVVTSKASGRGYFRAHSTLHKNIWALEVKNGADRGFYLIAGEARKLLRRAENEDVKLFPCRLTLCYARDSGLFLWPLRLSEEGRRNQLDEWSLSAQRICTLAETCWVKLYTKKGGNCYSHKIAVGITAEPPWPDATLEELAAIAFEGKYITDANDPLIKRLLGKE
jgi:hypothetical protein